MKEFKFGNWKISVNDSDIVGMEDITITHVITNVSFKFYCMSRVGNVHLGVHDRGKTFTFPEQLRVIMEGEE